MKTQTGQTAPAAPESDKAQLILLERENHMVTPFHDATVRWEMDGAWVGADNGNSYFALAINPDVHNICVNWQSSLKALKNNVDLTLLTAEPDQTYYFQVDVNVESQYSVSFAPSQVNDYKGQYLVKTSALSMSKAE